MFRRGRGQRQEVRTLRSEGDVARCLKSRNSRCQLWSLQQACMRAHVPRETRNCEAGGPGWFMGMGATVSGNPNGLRPGGVEEKGRTGPSTQQEWSPKGRVGGIEIQAKCLENNNKPTKKLGLNHSALITCVILKFLLSLKFRFFLC